MKDHLILNDSIYAERQYPLELLPPQSDFQGKIFLRKNFHPFSGLFQWTGPVGIMGTTERVKIFPQKFFALEVGLGREELQGINSYFHSMISNNSETLKLTSHLLQGSTTFFILILLTEELSQSPGSKLEETITSV